MIDTDQMVSQQKHKTQSQQTNAPITEAGRAATKNLVRKIVRIDRNPFAKGAESELLAPCIGNDPTFCIIAIDSNACDGSILPTAVGSTVSKIPT